MTNEESSIDDLLAQIDLAAIADPGDKVRECEFFLALASVEPSREQFRWLITAFLSAVYSYFETSALYANVAFTHPETGEPIADDVALEKMRAFVKIKTDPKTPFYIKTAGYNALVQRLYKFRAGATHRFPLSITAAGPNLPEEYHFGSTHGQGEPILQLCKEALVVVKRVEEELNS